LIKYDYNLPHFVKRVEVIPLAFYYE